MDAYDHTWFTSRPTVHLSISFNTTPVGPMPALPCVSAGLFDVGTRNTGPTPQISFECAGEKNTEAVMSEVPDSGIPLAVSAGAPTNGRMNRKIRFQSSFSVIGTTGWTFSTKAVLSNGAMCANQLNWNGMLTMLAIGLASCFATSADSLSSSSSAGGAAACAAGCPVDGCCARADLSMPAAS